MPIPLTRRAFLRRGAVGLTVASALVSSPSARSAPVPVRPPRPGGFLVLDNCDPDYQGKAAYADNLSFYDPAGKLVARVIGLNNCEEIGSPHKIALDVRRGLVWAVENVGKRLLQFNRKGQQLRAVANANASAVAVDPDTGNVWALRGPERFPGTGKTDVYGPAGARLATHDFHGWDIVYDPKGKAFWAAQQELLKVSLAGRVLTRRPLTNWNSSSLAVNACTGDVWVTTRHHSGRLGRDALLGFDNEGRPKHDIPLAGAPFRVAVDSASGSVWVTIFRRSVLKFTAAGRPDGQHKVAAVTADVEPGTGNVWVVTQQEVMKLDGKGKVLARARHAGPSSQAWALAY
jgi:hypothetical protein